MDDEAEGFLYEDATCDDDPEAFAMIEVLAEITAWMTMCMRSSIPAHVYDVYLVHGDENIPVFTFYAVMN